MATVVVCTECGSARPAGENGELVPFEDDFPWCGSESFEGAEPEEA